MSDYLKWTVAGLEWLYLYFEKDHSVATERWAINPHAASHSLELLLKAIVVKWKSHDSFAMGYSHNLSKIISDIISAKIMSDQLKYDANLFSEVDIELKKTPGYAHDVCMRLGVSYGEYEYYVLIKYCGDLKYLGAPLKKINGHIVNIPIEYPNLYLCGEIRKILRYLSPDPADLNYNSIIDRFRQMKIDQPWNAELLENNFIKT